MPQLSVDHAPHADHDVLLVSAWVAGDVDANEQQRAEALIASCADCAQLADDLRAIAAALPASGIPARPRDFRLTDADAYGARRAGPRWSLDALRSALRPAGAGLATLGIAGLLLAGVSGLGGPGQQILSNFGSSVSVPAAGAGNAYDRGSTASSGAQPVSGAPAAAAGPSTATASPASSAALGPEVVSTPPPSAVVAASPGSDKSLTSGAGLGPTPPPATPSGPSPLFVGSVAALVIGLALLLAGRLSRGRADAGG
jgi:hypothetical protein